MRRRRKKPIRVERCELCRDTGVVGIYSPKTVNTVLRDGPIRLALRVALACRCKAADARFNPIEREDGVTLERFDPSQHCALPYLGYVPNAGTSHDDYRAIVRWANARAVSATIGEIE